MFGELGLVWFVAALRLLFVVLFCVVLFSWCCVVLLLAWCVCGCVRCCVLLLHCGVVLFSSCACCVLDVFEFGLLLVRVRV